MTTWSSYDAADYLETEEKQLEYLTAIIELGDPLAIQAALGSIARARGMSAVSETTGLSRENLYRSLSGTKEARFSTIFKVLNALGYQLKIMPKTNAQ